MNLTRLEQFGKEVQALVAAYDEMTDAIIGLRRNQQLTDKLDDAGSTKSLQMAVALDRQEKSVITVLDMLANKLNIEADADVISRWVEEYSVKVGNVAKMREHLTEHRARHELMAELGDLEEAEDRVQSEAVIETASKRFEKALEIASRMVPNQAVLVGTNEPVSPLTIVK